MVRPAPRPVMVGGETPPVETPPAAMVETMFDLGYRHWLSVIHDDGHVAFALNNRDVPPSSWGNCVWFRNHEAFLAAVRWCGTSMPEMIRSAGGR